MIRLIVLMLTTVLGVVFAMSNTHHVAVSVLFGSPVQIRMIFLLGLAFLSGFLVSYFVRVYNELRHRSAVIRALVRANGARQVR